MQPVDGGDSFLAVDRVQAGVGDLVLVNQEGNGTRQLLEDGRSRCRSARSSSASSTQVQRDE